MEHLSHSEQETEQLGEQVARRLPRGTVIAYTGELGMGKTAFTRGLARGLGCRGLARGGVCAVEWSERAEDAFDGSTVRIDFRRSAQHDGWRVITITGVDGL